MTFHKSDSKLDTTNTLEVTNSLQHKDETAEIAYWESIAKDIEELAGIMKELKCPCKESIALMVNNLVDSFASCRTFELYPMFSSFH